MTPIFLIKPSINMRMASKMLVLQVTFVGKSAISMSVSTAWSVKWEKNYPFVSKAAVTFFSLFILYTL